VINIPTLMQQGFLVEQNNSANQKIKKPQSKDDRSYVKGLHRYITGGSDPSSG
jgi:hypothetical protein